MISELEDLFVDVRNKLQLCRTTLELSASGKSIPKNIFLSALDSLALAEKAINEFEVKQKRGSFES